MACDWEPQQSLLLDAHAMATATDATIATTQLRQRVQHTRRILRQWSDVHANDTNQQVDEAAQHALQQLQSLARSLYGKCVIGLAGGLDVIRDRLAHFLALSQPSPSEIDQVVHTLQLFARIVDEEQDNAAHAAQRGMHMQLLKLMEHSDELVQEATSEAIASCCTCQNFCFPFRAKQLEEVERVMPHIIILPLLGADEKQLEVVVRQVSTRMTGQSKTGYLLWGAAFVLARYVQLNRDQFFGKQLLEVGSGLGLSGIVAGRYAQRTILTDYQQDTLDALRYNVELNHAFIHGQDEIENVTDSPSQEDEETKESKVTVEHLDWDTLEETSSKVDVIIASDIICEPSTAEGFLRVLRHRLDPVKGVAYLMNANAHSRFGVVHLHHLLQTQQHEFISTITPVHDLSDGHVLLDTVPDAQILSYEFYEIRLAKPTET